METRELEDDLWDDGDEDGLAEASCLAREECIEALVRDAEPGCLYCRLAEWGEGEDLE